MNRKLLFRITIPSVLFGVFLFAACSLSIRYIHRLQSNLAEILTQNVRSLQEVQELEIQVRQLRFHTFLHLLDPSPERLKKIEDDEKLFKEALHNARSASASKEEDDLLTEIEESFKEHESDHEQLAQQAKGRPLAEVFAIVDRHPIRLVIEPCQKLLKINKDKMQASASESQDVSREGYLAMLFLGIAGPIGGLVTGYGVTRGLRRSIYQLSVRVQDLAHHLDQDVGSVSVLADGDFEALEEKMHFIVQKVEEAARKIQEQQQELLRTEQLSQVGHLAAGVAHEIRNPLTGIKMLVEAAIRAQSPRPLNLEDTQMIFREVKRLEQTVQQFLDFARLPAPEIAPCDLREVIRKAWEIVRIRATQLEIEPSFHLPSDAVVVLADAGQMNTVLVNLFLNALDAIGTQGRLDVNLSSSEQGTVRLRICDTGPGIPPEIQERLFQPFATSKPHGTGLGLFLTARILDEHRGTISASNRPEGGACFTITLKTHANGGENP